MVWRWADSITDEVTEEDAEPLYDDDKDEKESRLESWVWFKFVISEL